jgi:two-component system chemotaxis response regulator CheY
MINLDLTDEYLAECRERLVATAADLTALGAAEPELDAERIRRAFRAVRAVKTAASLLDLEPIAELAQRTEEALAPIRACQSAATPENTAILLCAIRRLDEQLRHPAAADRAENAEVLAGLAKLRPAPPASAGKRPAPGRPRMLLAEDDFACRLLLQTFLARHGECHVAVNGREAVEAFRFAADSGQGYDLICMDIMMPEMDGCEAVHQIRALEEARGIPWGEGVKIVMTTALDDLKDVSRSFSELCDAYLTKPIALPRLLAYMKTYGLVA